MKSHVIIMAVLLLIAHGIHAREKGGSGELVIFHAGSLALPMREITKSFQREYPQTKVILESAGSLACARKITDLRKPCDVFASADYSIITELLIPNQARWAIPFSGNEMAIVYHERSRKHKEISSGNWFEILLDEDVSFGRSDPNMDPCGYRAIFTMLLAEKYYKRGFLARRLQEKNREYIRPKETDLLALLEMGEIDYIFLYRSVAVQHGLMFLALPDEINLKRPDLGALYSTVEVGIAGKNPGSSTKKKGAPIVYGVTIPSNSPNPETAQAFVDFLLDEERGMKILEECGQNSREPCETETFSHIPNPLRKYAKPVRDSKEVEKRSQEHQGAIGKGSDK